jgi:hypothetical protein
MDYKNGKIYKLVSPSGLVYVGSTCQALSKRKTTHKNDYKRWKAGDQHFMTSYKLFDESVDDIDIVLLEDCPCERKEQLHARERHWIDNTECVNKQKPGGRTLKEYREGKEEEIKEYYQKNKGRILSHQKNYYHNNKHIKAEYHQKNKDKIKEYKSQPIACGCGFSVQKGSYPRHLRTIKHIQWMESQTKPVDE